MLTHTFRSVLRLTLATVVGGTLVAGTLAGPANAADDRPQSGAGGEQQELFVRKAGGEQQELFVRKAGGEQQELFVRKAGGEQQDSSIIAVL